MANNYDANIKLLYPVDDGSFFTADTVQLGQPFDLIANVEIGEEFMEIVDEDELLVSVVNVSQAVQVAQKSQSRTVAPSNAALNAELRVDIDPGWETNAQVGDVLEAIATYRVRGGLNTDFSVARSGWFIVTN